jgi:hypothetical protein
MALLQQEAIACTAFLRSQRVAGHLSRDDHGPAARSGNGRWTGHTTAADWPASPQGRHCNKEL